MRVESHLRFKPSVSVDATRVVVYDDYDNPVMIALQVGPDQLLISKIHDPDFEAILQNFGINKSVFVTELHPKPI